MQSDCSRHECDRRPLGRKEFAVEILVNDEPYQSAGPAEQTVRDVTEEVCRTGETGGSTRLVVALRCNGEPVPDAGLGDRGKTTLTRDAIKSMSSDDINARWEEVSEVLGRPGR